ncbi:sortase [Rhodococcus sp. IEGM 1379]|uniref:class F sortase n=1 Tax=Rhodococcus sp. IEGM 1379 TaxID=3047086 RepID=UPI0024B7F69E|nr:sortase [Rhodococcus sp. IEGM 1379]MDI9918261.1 sortase [Rhodococcus sp. IEGM 1379]
MTLYSDNDEFGEPDEGSPAGPSNRYRKSGIIAIIAALVVGIALAFFGFQSSSDTTAATPPVPGSVVTSDQATTTVPVHTPMAPNTLALDAVGVRAPIVDATVPDGVLTPPENVKDVGIWLDGAPLDSATGTTLIVGHVNLTGQGNGALFDLGTISPGETIRTSDAAGKSTSWKVTAVTTRPKADGVEESVLAGHDGPRKLAVVTCGGELQFDGGVGNYADNVYLYADLIV